MNEANKNHNHIPECFSPGKPEILSLVKQSQQETFYPSELTLPDKSTVIANETSHNCPGYVTFANEFSYFMDYSGQGYGYVFRNEGWRCDINYTLADILTGYAMRPCCLMETPESLEQLYKTVGFPSRQTFYADSTKGEYMSKEEMKDAIKYTLFTLEHPVILKPIERRFFGAIVIGYKEDGDVLVTFGYPPYFIAPENIEPQIEDIDDWYQASTEITIIGKRQKKLAERELYYQGMLQIRDYLRAGVCGEDSHYYDEWENFLRLESMDEMVATAIRLKYIPGAQMFSCDLNADNAREKMNVLADPTWCEMAERRYYIMHFFYQAAQHFPEEKEAMKEIENHFGWSNSIMGDKYIKEVGHDPVTEAFEKADVRARMSDCIREFRDADAKGLEMLEILLERIKL